MEPSVSAPRSARSLAPRSRAAAAALAVIALLVALAFGVGVSAPQAASGAVPVSDIEIFGPPKLYVESPGGGAGYNAAWVVFRTRPHLHIARQVVVEVRGLKGRSYGGSGARNCVRSTVIQASKVVRHARTYRVRFYARPGSHGTARTLLRTVTLAAHRFASPPGRVSVPHC